MSPAPPHEIDVTDLIELLREVHEQWPSAVVTPNAVQNLAVLVDGKFVGWVDLGIHEVERAGTPGGGLL